MAETKTDVEQVLEKTTSDPRFMRGLALLKEKRYEEAVAIYEDMLRTMIEVENESESLAVAPVYYEYGHALLSLAEATASVFGSSVQPSEENEGDVEQEARETADDLQVAWEMLEIARVIYSRQPEELAVEKELARVYMRLGDLGMESEVFGQAKNDYEKSLMLRKKILTATNDPDTTLLADLYCCLAISCIYQDTAPKNDDPFAAPVDKVQSIVNREEEGMKYYVLAGRVMAENIYRVAKTCPSQLLDFVQQRIPESSGEDMATPSKGKGKRKATSDEDNGLPFLLDNMASLREDFLTCVQVYKNVRDSKEESKTSGDVNADNLNKDEAQLLEYLEIYVELKEKVDAIKESTSAEAVPSTSAEATKTDGPVTTIGFGAPASTPTATASSNGDAAPAAPVVNLIPVVKKRKITPQTSAPTATEEQK
ncbi:hypothetical protein Poli38472_000288 [Pythium oligandrum]|uniref:Tetratricopeptide SHNi-TPR domain-containing protein n=1 Tax=Pythium oligandrum TaxID=41045 RepID=A0A8K1CBG3_PYTOL|nr:hypothetical protein Poli38472_000288 [Pythium oligandrum]|eukprot:TMW60246.1 hypothetical protein Poli38472_000288 [Pythium oligandrum]